MSDSLLMVQNARASSLMTSLRVSSFHRCAVYFLPVDYPPSPCGEAFVRSLLGMSKNRVRLCFY
nr:hypothetical protein PJ912_18840 [Pectobacterium colocasium]